MKRMRTKIVSILAFMSLLPVKALAAVQPIPQVDAPAGVTGVTAEQIIKNITNTLAFVAGALAVIAIIVGGIMYITSAGDEKRVEMAKNTILYAVVGMVIAILAYAIANFVVAGVTTGK